MCLSITLLCTEELNCLASNQEVVDTKVILQCSQAVLENQDIHVILRSPSGDTDILVLAVSLLANEKQRIVLDNAAGLKLHLHLIWPKN